MSAVAAYGSLAPCQPIFECLDGMYNTKLMYVGVDLGIHDALAGGVTMTAQQLADKLHLKADRLERFLRTLVFLNLIEEHENGFRNSPSSEMYLVSSSPRCFLGYLTLSEHTAKTFSEGLINTLKGQGRLDKRQTQDNNNTFTYDNNMYDQKYEAKIFGEGMQAIGRSDMDCIKYVDFTGIKTVVDLGGNLGWQAREIRRFHPSVENVIVAELERVTQIGSQIPENQNARIEFRTVDFLTDELPQADAYILGHVIHCYSAAQCKELLKKIHKALTPGGLLVLLESVLQPKKTAPGWALILDIIMLVDLAGCERSADEYKALLASESFTDFSCHFVEGGTFFDVITARKA